MQRVWVDLAIWIHSPEQNRIPKARFVFERAVVAVPPIIDNSIAI
jgi:hypothetical protein